MSRGFSDCCHYDEGYDDGYEDAMKENEGQIDALEEEFEHQNSLNNKEQEAIELCFIRAAEYRKRNEHL
jgi:hypothetical protein